MRWGEAASESSVMGQRRSSKANVAAQTLGRNHWGAIAGAQTAAAEPREIDATAQHFIGGGLRLDP